MDINEWESKYNRKLLKYCNRISVEINDVNKNKIRYTLNSNYT